MDALLAALFFAVAVLYASVGHAGASGYIAAMALLGFVPEQVRPTALALNLLVGGIGLLRWWRGGHVRWRNVLPFVLASAPAAYFAAQVQLPRERFAILLGLLLAYLIAEFAGWQVAWAPVPVLLSAAFCAVVGLAFGVYPARQASRLDPITALRHD